jgi:hypothetical protein
VIGGSTLAGSFVDEDCYATGWGPGARLKRDRQELVNRLRKKANDKQVAVQPADKLEGCKATAGCESGACPECSHAARQLVTQVTRRFLKEQPSSDTIACMSIVPRASKPGKPFTVNLLDESDSQ